MTELDMLKRYLLREMAFRHAHTVPMYWQNRFFRKKASYFSANLMFYC